ncbi:MAG: hypothetical protein AAB380_08630, partial [Verrucomicrobiota bacterium]
MKLKRPEFLFVGFAVALALLGGVAWFGWRHTAHMQETAALVAHTERERDAWARRRAMPSRPSLDART